MKKINLEKLEFWRKGRDTGSFKSEKVDLDKQWKRAFAFFVILVFALVVLEIRMFFRIDQESIFESVSPKSVKVENIDRAEVIKVLEYYENKTIDFQNNTRGVNNLPVLEEDESDQNVEESVEDVQEN